MPTDVLIGTPLCTWFTMWSQPAPPCGGHTGRHDAVSALLEQRVLVHAVALIATLCGLEHPQILDTCEYNR